MVVLGVPAQPGRSQTCGLFPCEVMLAQRYAAGVSLVGCARRFVQAIDEDFHDLHRSE